MSISGGCPYRHHCVSYRGFSLGAIHIKPRGHRTRRVEVWCPGKQNMSVADYLDHNICISIYNHDAHAFPVHSSVTLQWTNNNNNIK